MSRVNIVIKKADYIAIMNKCLCRSAYACQNFPHDHACIFIGKGAKGIVKTGNGRKVEIKEALAHIDKGAELGLIGQALWIEVERLILGLKRKDGVAHWLEICFCCPCCCGTFKLNNATNLVDIKGRFRSIGWKAELKTEDCNQCRVCIGKCPVKAISLEGDGIIINTEQCLGCGLCAAGCKQNALELTLRQPLLDRVEDYFIQGGLKIEL